MVLAELPEINCIVFVIWTAATMKFALSSSVLLWPAALAVVIRNGAFSDLSLNSEEAPEADRSFTVGKNCFLKDGKPFRYVSGSFHYWRQPPAYWEDTFAKMRAAGLNTVQTYINWALHEPEPGRYNFKGDVDVRRFFTLAQKQGLLVILRPGPFIDAEVDMGGLPYWLLRENPHMTVRTTDASFLHYVQRWYNVMLPLLDDLLYVNGGPISTVQVENEYGSYGSDMVYKQWLRNLTTGLLGNDVVLFTTDGDGASYVQGGYINGTLTTLDFGAGGDVASAFQVERMFNPDGPLVNSEFYPGWLDHWGEAFNFVDSKSVVQTMKEMLDVNASLNVYMFYGGTNFGFVAGANGDQNSFQPIITSYDYDAPLSEAGDTNGEKYQAVRQLLGQYVPLPPGPVPPSRPKAAYGKFNLAYRGSMYDFLDTLLTPDGPTVSDLPLTFEALSQPYGFVLYRTHIRQKYRDPSLLTVLGLHDRAIVLVDKIPATILSRSAGIYSAPVELSPGTMLDILVQNEGRICWGPAMNFEMKGILGNVSINGQNLTEWEMYPFDLPGFPVHSPRALKLDKPTRKPVQGAGSRNVPGFYSVSFSVDVAQDTYLNMNGWRMGYAFINGRNLGRYWPVQGPQVTLYLPGVYLKSGKRNVLDIFELERAPCGGGDLGCTVEFTDIPVLNGTIPQFSGQRKKLSRMFWKGDP